jgi:DEAD/DEAH box helicase domain-containing protein
MADFLIYDAEILRVIPPRDERDRDLTLDYCDGWNDHKGMGISVVGFGTSKREWFWDATAPDPFLVRDFQTAKENGNLVVGFNSRSFDDRLMAAHGIEVQTDYDLLEEVRIAAGFAAHWQSVPKGFSYKLDAIAKANGMAKTGSGELAPKLWQEGKHQEVIEYCLMDIKITRQMLLLGLAGELVDPNTGRMLQLRELPNV